MKVDIVQNTHEPKYPWIGKSKTGIIVLFYDYECGIALNSNNSYDVGDHTTSWIMSEFTHFDGSVTLSN